MLRHPSLKHRATMPLALSMALAWYTTTLPQPQSFILVLLPPSSLYVVRYLPFVLIYCSLCSFICSLCSFVLVHVPFLVLIFIFVFLVLFLVLLACVLWAVFMLFCPFHAGTWPIAADRCGSVRLSDLSCGCAVPRYPITVVRRERMTVEVTMDTRRNRT